MVDVVAAYNVLIIGSMVVASLAMFILCSMLFGNSLVSVVCGAVYGFSPYMVAESLGHPHLTSTSFCIPLVAAISLKYIRGELYTKKTTLLYGSGIAFVLLAELLLGEEVYATTWIAGVLAIGVLWATSPMPKAQFKALFRLGLTAGAANLVICSPFLAYQILGPARPHGAIQPFNVYVADIFNFVVPGPLQWIKDSATSAISSHFTGNGSEWTSYIGVPFLLIILFVSIKMWDKKIIRAMSLMLGLVVLLSLGPDLHVDGYVTHIKLPWAVFERLPLLNSVLPARLSVYCFFLVTLFLGYFMIDFIVNNARKYTVRVLSLASLAAGLALYAPQIGAYPTSSPPVVPKVFVNGSLDKVVARHSDVLVIPLSTGGHASAMYWQQESEFYFKMPEGYAIDKAGFGPKANMLQSDILSLESGGRYRMPTKNQLDLMRGYLRYLHINSILLAASPGKENIEKLVDAVIGTRPNFFDGAYVWRVPQHLVGYYVEGDYWHTAAKYNWMGKSLRIVSYGIPVEVTLSGMWRPVSRPVRITAFLGNGVKESYEVAQTSKVMFTVGAYTDVFLRAGKTFIPNDYLHNGDERHLSVLIHADAGA
jgi:hypothetical protein